MSEELEKVETVGDNNLAPQEQIAETEAAEATTETPLGEQLDSGNDEFSDEGVEPEDEFSDEDDELEDEGVEPEDEVSEEGIEPEVGGEG